MALIKRNRDWDWEADELQKINSTKGFDRIFRS